MLEDPLSALQAIHAAVAVMRKLVDGDEIFWDVTNAPDCMIVSEKRAFLDDLENIDIGSSADKHIPFRDLLLLSERADVPGMVGLVSDRVGYLEDQVDGVTVLAGSSAGALPFMRIASRNLMRAAESTS